MKWASIHFAIFLQFILLVCCKSSKNSENSANSAQLVKAVFINGDSLHYKDIGKGDPVIFIHGALGDYRGFKGQLDTFSKTHRVIVYSRRYAFPDNGPVKDSLDYKVDIHVADLAEFIKKLNIGPAHLVGHSYGGFVALQLTLSNPELVRTVTLCEPAYPSLLDPKSGENVLSDEFDKNFRIPAGEAFKKGENEKALKIFITGVTGDSSMYSKIPEAQRNEMLSNIPETRAIAITQHPFPQVTCDELKKIKTPVLLVGGEKSPALFIATTRALNNCLSNRELTILRNASHGLQNENPADFNKIALEFMNKH